MLGGLGRRREWREAPFREHRSVVQRQTAATAAPEPVRTGRPSRAFAWLVVTLGWLVVPALCVAAFAAWNRCPGSRRCPTSGVQALLPKETSAGKAELEADRLFGSALLPRIAVVQRNPARPALAQQRRIVGLAVPARPRPAARLPAPDRGRCRT